MTGDKNLNSDPHPGELRHLIEIGYTESTVNANGYPEPKDIVLCKVWAGAQDVGSSAFQAADAAITEGVINFTVRYRPGVQPGMWVRYWGVKRVITALYEYDFKRRYLGLKTTIVKGVS